MTKIWLVLLAVLTIPGIAYANPLGPHPTQLAAWIIVAGASLLLEVFVTTGILLFSGIAVVPIFCALVLGNLISYGGIAIPLYSAVERAWLVEIVIVTAETAFIMSLGRFELFQGETFDGLKWRYAFLSALAGNACSYYVGLVLASAAVA